VFPDSRGGRRDPSNTSRDLRAARGSDEFAWVTSHVFRKTAATEVDRAGLSARQIADQLGHAKVSMTQDRYLGRRGVGKEAAAALDRAHRAAPRRATSVFSRGKRRGLARRPSDEALTWRLCSSDWTRTSNPAINSRMLCQLSYGGPYGRGAEPRWQGKL